ncbi:MAG: chorismate-binding protein [Flavobacteriaceae bacterium]|nr:chorismate-binding protein [Flavobacteriaceae bacterium]
MKQIEDKINQAYTNQLPFVVYNKPKEEKVVGLFQKDSQLHTLTTNFNKSGFVFAPFTSDRETIIFPLETSVVIEESYAKKALSLKEASAEDSQQAKKKHIALITKAINAIATGNFEKVVLSRKVVKEIETIDIVEVYQKLLNTYPNAFVYVWYHPSVGLWFGATPETLLNIKNYTFTTMALAGTQLYIENTKAVWQPKELQEQEFVTEYIVQKLSQFAKDIQLSETTTVKAGSLLHLKTDISARLDTAKNDSLYALITTLHPTPAVCGLPKEITKQFILENENYNRSYYTGFLGELNMCNGQKRNSSHLFVNLRCMEFKDNSAFIYVGGGITKDSVAEKEYQETVSKSKIMLKVL